jgi:hypothetical protein
MIEAKHRGPQRNENAVVTGGKRRDHREISSRVGLLRPKVTGADLSLKKPLLWSEEWGPLQYVLTEPRPCQSEIRPPEPFSTLHTRRESLPVKSAARWMAYPGLQKPFISIE